MKLLFCLFNYFPFGGLQRDFLRIARECLKRGHEIHVCTMQWDGAIEPQFHLHLLKKRGLQNHQHVKHFVAQVKDHLAENQYDLVIGFNKMPYLDFYYAADVCYQARIAARAKLKRFIYRLSPRYQTLYTMEKAVFAAHEATNILLIAANQEQEYRAHYHTERARFHLLPPGIHRDYLTIDRAKEKRAAFRDSLELHQNDFLLLAVGSGFKTKGLDRSLKAIAALPDSLKSRVKLMVIGQDRASHFIRLAAQLNIAQQVIFLGGRHDVPDFLMAGDVLLHPAYHENTGTVLLEALASGLPVIATDVCGYAHHILASHAGTVLSSPFQQQDYNDELQSMLSSNKLTQLAQNGVRYAKNADIYSLPYKAADLIEQVGMVKRDPTPA